MLEVKHLVKTYSPKGGVTVRALDDVSIVFPEKGMVFLLCCFVNRFLRDFKKFSK